MTWNWFLWIYWRDSLTCSQTLTSRMIINVEKQAGAGECAGEIVTERMCRRTGTLSWQQRLFEAQSVRHQRQTASAVLQRHWHCCTELNQHQLTDEDGKLLLLIFWKENAFLSELFQNIWSLVPAMCGENGAEEMKFTCKSIQQNIMIVLLYLYCILYFLLYFL